MCENANPPFNIFNEANGRLPISYWFNLNFVVVVVVVVEFSYIMIEQIGYSQCNFVVLGKFFW